MHMCVRACVLWTKASVRKGESGKDAVAEGGGGRRTVVVDGGQGLGGGPGGICPGPVNVLVMVPELREEAHQRLHCFLHPAHHPPISPPPCHCLTIRPSDL